MTERSLTWSYGGGTQSVAIAVLVAQGRLPKPECIVMANTSREATETWEYSERYVQPLLAPLGLHIEVAPHTLATVDLYRNETLLIPAFTNSGKLDTYCSGEWKREVIKRYLRSLGYGPKRPVRTWIGISKDEIGRAKPGDTNWQELYWPLLYDITMSRRECYALVESAGLPVPPKSSCWMCPFRQNAQWRRLRDHYPADFVKACELDEEIRATDTKGGVFVHRSRSPLATANLEEPDAPVHPLFGEVDGCDSGLCWV